MIAYRKMEERDELRGERKMLGVFIVSRRFWFVKIMMIKLVRQQPKIWQKTRNLVQSYPLFCFVISQLFVIEYAWFQLNPMSKSFSCTCVNSWEY